jgi:PAS domain S-box-containing protein
MHPTECDSPDRRESRRYLRDFTALTALPAVWSRADRRHIAEGLADVLVRILYPDFIYVRLEGLRGREPITVLRLAQEGDVAEWERAIGEALGLWLPCESSATAVFPLPHPLGDGLVQAAATPIGSACEFGVLVAASGQPGFPTEEDRLLLGVAANQAAIVLQRRQVEDALRQQSELLRITLASIGDAVITTDTEGRVTSLNPVAESLTGWTQQDAQGKPLDDVFRAFHEESGQPVVNPATKSLREGQVVGLANHAVLRARDGTERAVDDSAAPIKDPQGNVLGVVLIFRDVTEARRAVEARLRLSAIVESSDDAIISKNLDGIIVSWNKAAERLYGYTAEEVVGKPIALLVPPDQPDELPGIMARLRRGERIEHFETVRVCKDGRRLDVSLTISPVKGAGGRIIGASKIARDITARKQAEEMLRQSEARFRQIATENASLLEALKEADHRKDEFLAILAHELRNPLAPVKNAVQILQAKGPPVPELQWARGVIDRQVRQLTRLVDDLLDVSRINKGKIELRKERAPLAEVVNGAVEASRPLIEKWGHKLTVALPAEPLFLEADQARLSQVVQNLLNNAAKYTEQGGRIWLTAERQGDQALIRVKDTGIGIPPAMLSRIFDMFTQVDRSLERSQGGLGIGLTLVQRLVELHGGTVKVVSPGPGKGSEFTIRLPIAPEVRGKEMQQPGADGEEEAGSKRRILVVDDNKDAADSLAMLLRITGNEVHSAYDGLEAVGAVAAFQPDIVLMDIGLPKLNGYDAARRMREQPSGQGAVLIALTGWGQDEDRRRSKEAGFDYHMVKPVDPAELQGLLRELGRPSAK